jgi:hypothetical protein
VLLDDLDAVGDEAVAQGDHRVAVGHVAAEVHPPGAGQRVVGAEREREALRVVEHQHAVVVDAGRSRAEAEVGLVEAARGGLVADGEGQVVHVLS